MKIYCAADHAGFELKNMLVEYARGLGHEVEDCGAFSNDPADDYPSIIATAARKLSIDSLEGKDSRAIVIGASGQGEAIVANRFKGVRCATYYGFAGEQKDMSGKKLDMISSTREHNNANALSLGARFLTVEEAKKAVEKWLKTDFSGEERHARRIKLIDALDF
ncbi:MAG: RpiB/LacA/LacB family sugar-phosphate isomerase [Patescibacteria group bacterium]